MAWVRIWLNGVGYGGDVVITGEDEAKGGAVHMEE